MDWIEELFGVSPDGGNGVLELIILAVIAIAITVEVLLVRRDVHRRIAR